MAEWTPIRIQFLLDLVAAPRVPSEFAASDAEIKASFARDRRVSDCSRALVGLRGDVLAVIGEGAVTRILQKALALLEVAADRHDHVMGCPANDTGDWTKCNCWVNEAAELVNQTRGWFE